MSSYNKIIHYPNLRTILDVERVLKEHKGVIKREEIKRKLRKKIMHQSLNLIIEFFEGRGLVEDKKNGVRWIGKNDFHEVHYAH